MVKRHSSEAGYNLVILMVAMTLLNIALAIALPKWSHVIRREKEEELISRGFQYAEAIRMFQNRHQRLPVRIQELVEVEPRSIRKLWKDPMTEDGNWVLIPPGGGPQGGPQLNPQPTGPDGKPLPRDGQEDPDGRPPEPDDDMEIDPDTGIGQKKGTQQIGPFSGVHSRSGKESILIFNGRTRYDEWHFTLEMIQALLAGNPTGVGGDPARGNAFGGGVPARNPNLSTRWLGRPLPEFLTTPQNQMPQDGQMPNGRTPKPPATRR
jgi:type II secretory pathway pseudopilin PulG